MRRVLRLRGGHQSPVNAGEVAAAFATAAQTGGARQGTEVVVELGIPPLQRRILRDLPPGRLGDIRALVSHQASRFFRVPVDGLVIGVARQPGAASGYLAVAVDAGVVRAVLAAATSAGFRVRDITTSVGQTGPSLSLLPPEEVDRRTRRSQRRTGWLAGATAGYAVILLGGAALFSSRGMGLAAKKLEQIRAPALQVQRVQKQLDSVVGMIRLVADARGVNRSLLEHIGLIAAALPDSAVLTVLTVRRLGAIELGGLALDPLALVARLHRASEFESARLDGEPVAEAAGARAWSRYRVRIEIGGAR